MAEEAVKRKLVSRVGRETIRILLLDHDLKPWREKMWCVPELNAEYVAKMEDVLKTYEQPHDDQQPVVCLDEKPVACKHPVNTGNREKIVVGGSNESARAKDRQAAPSRNQAKAAS